MRVDGASKAVRCPKNKRLRRLTSGVFTEWANVDTPKSLWPERRKSMAYLWFQTSTYRGHILNEVCADIETGLQMLEEALDSGNFVEGYVRVGKRKYPFTDTNASDVIATLLESGVV